MLKIQLQPNYYITPILLHNPNVFWDCAIVKLRLYMNQGPKEESGPSGKGKSENKCTQIIRLSSFLILQGCDVLLVNVLFIVIIIIRYILIMYLSCIIVSN
jgi:hypothetical protein